MHCKMKENLLKKHSDCMRNTHFRALISPYKKKITTFQEICLKHSAKDLEGIFQGVPP